MLFSSFFKQDNEAAAAKTAAEHKATLAQLVKTTPHKILYGWIGTPQFSDQGIKLGTYTRRFSHPPRTVLKDAHGTRFVVWHDLSLRRTDTIARRFIERLENQFLTSPDVDVRTQAERTLIALQKDLANEKKLKNPSAEQCIEQDARAIFAKAA